MIQCIFFLNTFHHYIRYGIYKIHLFSYNPPPLSSLDILFEDEFLLILNKPSGLLSVPGRGADKQDCLISRVQLQYPSALIVHRLDMSTSGLMILALNKDMESILSTLFQKRKVEKKYIAVVEGQVEKNEGLIDLPIITDWPNRPKQKVDYDCGKPSETLYKILQINNKTDTSRLELTPLTGRTHQLRLHLQAIGHAILGDELYASKKAQKMATRLNLHASELRFTHPITDEYLSFNSAPDF